MKKICFILGNYFKYHKGGAELQSYLIAKKLVEKHEMHFIFVNPPNYAITKNIQALMREYIYIR